MKIAGKLHKTKRHIRATAMGNGISNYRHRDLVSALLVIAIVAFLGVRFFITSHAATFAASQETESGTVAGNASLFTDANASAGSYVKFGGSTVGSAPCGATQTPPQTYSHVIILLMENHDYSEVIGNSAAPYQTQLANECGEATNYSSVGSPSLPNYIGLTSGNIWGSTFTGDCDPTGACTSTAPNIFTQVLAAGKTWKAYEETMPSNCTLTDSGNYAVRHNPPPYYTQMRSDCSARDIPMGTTSSGNFLNDLNNNTLPDFSFITPDVCNDTHDCSVATGDNWLKSWVPKILGSSAYQSGNTAFILTYDEGDTGDIIPMTIVAPSVPTGYRSATAFNHYSMLKTIEQMLGINTYLQNASTATSMRSAFNL